MPGQLVHQRPFPGGRVFEVVIYDLLAEPVDAIVNAANGGLSHGGGIAAAISAAAGEDLDRECAALVARHGRIPAGEAVVTTAGRLPFKGVIHAVGPRRGDGDEEAMLVKALTSAFLRAEARGWTSLSFPGVSSGMFLVPVDVCVRAYFEAVERFFGDHDETSLRLLRLCLLRGKLLDAVRQLLG